MRELKTADQDINMVLNLAVSPGSRETNSSRMKDVFADCQFRKDNIILRNVANDFAISREVFSWELPKYEIFSYLEMFPGTPLTLVTPPVCDVLPIRTFTKVAVVC